MNPNASVQISQLILRQNYKNLIQSGIAQPGFPDVEFQCYSQNGEDGILLYIFSLLGTTNRKVLEICAGDGTECNAANLIINHGWEGLLFDGDAQNIAYGRAFYASCRTTCVAPPKLVDAWISAENINDLVTSNGFSGPIDLLSLDLDGNDYWIWKALDCVQPRVVLVEFNTSCGPDKSVSMSYKVDYRLNLSVQPYRCGASLAAFVKLARAKGYRLVGIQSLGFNAFFVRDGLNKELLPERSTQDCFQSNARMRDWTPAQLEMIISGNEKWEEV